MKETKENVEMDSNVIKNIMQKKPGKDDQHISGVAGMIFGVFLAVTILSVLLMDGRVSDLWIGLFVTGMTILGSIAFTTSTACLGSKV